MRNGFDRRVFGRRKTYKPSIVDTLDGQVIRCTVVDISDGGVRIQWPAEHSVPDLFTLVIPEDQIRVECELVHRLGSQFGARFVKSPLRTSPADEVRAARRAQLAQALLLNGYHRKPQQP